MSILYMKQGRTILFTYAYEYFYMKQGLIPKEK